MSSDTKVNFHDKIVKSGNVSVVILIILALVTYSHRSILTNTNSNILTANNPTPYNGGTPPYPTDIPLKYVLGY